MKENHLSNIENSGINNQSQLLALNTVIIEKLALLLVDPCEDFLFDPVCLNSIDDNPMAKESLSQALINITKSREKFNLPGSYLFIFYLNLLLGNDCSGIAVAGLRAMAQLGHSILQQEKLLAHEKKYFRFMGNLEDCITDLNLEIHEEALQAFFYLVNNLGKDFLIAFIDDLERCLLSEKQDLKIIALDVFAELGSAVIDLDAPKLSSLIDTVRQCFKSDDVSVVFYSSKVLLALESNALSQLDMWEFTKLLASIKLRLKDNNPTHRKAGLNAFTKLACVVDTLGNNHIRQFNELLENCLKDESAIVRDSLLQLHFAENLDNLVNKLWLKDFIPNIQKYLKGSNKQHKVSALHFLAQLTKPLVELEKSVFNDFAHNLHTCLIDEDVCVRKAASQVMHQLCGMSAVPRVLLCVKSLRECLATQSVSIIENTLITIQDLNVTSGMLDRKELNELITTLQALQNHTTASVRIVALKALVKVLGFCQLDLALIVNAIQLSLVDENCDVKKNALKMFACLRRVTIEVDEECISTFIIPLVLLLADENWSVKKAAVEAIGDLHQFVKLSDDTLFVALIDILGKSLKDNQERALCIASLNSIGCVANVLTKLDHAYVYSLFALLSCCLGDLRMGIREAAVHTIAKLGSISNAASKGWFGGFTHMLSHSMNSKDCAVKTAAVKALGCLLESVDTDIPFAFMQLFKKLPRCLADNNWSVKKAALDVVADLTSAIHEIDQAILLEIIEYLSVCLADRCEYVKRKDLHVMGQVVSNIIKPESGVFMQLPEFINEKEYEFKEGTLNTVQLPGHYRDAKRKGLNVVRQLASAVTIAEPNDFIPIIKKLPECISHEDDEVKIDALNAVSQFGNILDRLDAKFYALVIEMLQMNLSEKNEFVASAAVEAAIELLSTVSTQGDLFYALMRMLEECLEAENLESKDRAVAIVTKLGRRTTATRFTFVINMLQRCLADGKRETQAAVVAAACQLSMVLDNYMLQIDDAQRSASAVFLVQLWDIVLLQLENKNNRHGIIASDKLISLISVLTSPNCLQEAVVYFKNCPTLSFLKRVCFTSHSTKKITMVSDALEMLNNKGLLTIERAQEVMHKDRPLLAIVLCQLFTIGVLDEACVDSLITVADKELEKISESLKNHNQIAVILNFIHCHKLPITELNFEGWSLAKSGVQPLLRHIDKIPTLHTLNLKNVHLDKKDIIVLCRLLDAKEVPLNIRIDEFSDTDSKEAQQMLKSAIERNLTRAALLSYIIPETEKALLPFYKNIQSLESLVTTLCSPPETYKATLNGRTLILANCHYEYKGKGSKKNKKLITHYPGEPLFSQLNIDKDKAIEYLLNNFCQYDSIKKRLGDEVIRFMVENKNHCVDKNINFLDKEAQALLNEYDAAYEEQEILIGEINSYLDNKNSLEPLQKGFITSSLDTLCTCVSGDDTLKTALQALQQLEELRTLESKIKTLAYSNRLIEGYLNYAKITKNSHLGFDSVVAYLQIMGHGLAIYDPLKEVNQLTTVLEKSSGLFSGKPQMYYLLYDSCAGYQRLWNHALKDKREAENTHKQSLHKINDIVEKILQTMAECFTISDSSNLKAFHEAYKKGQALNSVHLHHFRVNGTNIKSKEDEIKPSLIATLDAINKNSKQWSQQERFSLLKHALLDFLRLEGQKKLSSQGYEEECLVKSVAGSPIFIRFASYLFQVSKRIREVEQPQVFVNFDYKTTFAAGFYRVIESSYVAAVAICSDLFKSSAIKPLNQREKIMHCVGEFVLGSLVAIPAVAGLAHAAKATLHSLHVLEEVAHIYEGVKDTLELGESVLENTKVGHALHSVYKCVSHKATKFLLGPTLATEEMIKNLQDTFSSSTDFMQKENKLREVLYTRFKEQLNLINSPQDVLVCGDAMARHILDKIMLGLLKPHTSEQPVLSLKNFIEACFEFISYVPMQYSPTVTTKEGRTILCDALFRQTGLACLAVKQSGLFEKKRIVKFRLSFEGMLAGKYKNFVATTFTSEHYTAQFGHRAAGKAEVIYLNNCLQLYESSRTKNPRVEVEWQAVMGNGMLSVCWDFPHQQFNEFFKKFEGWRFDVIAFDQAHKLQHNKIKHSVEKCGALEKQNSGWNTENNEKCYYAVNDNANNSLNNSREDSRDSRHRFFHRRKRVAAQSETHDKPLYEGGLRRRNRIK